MYYIVVTIPHNQQRYETVGDWLFTEPIVEEKPITLMHVNISDLGNQDSEFLVAIHEMVEAYLCRKAGISAEVVDIWDEDFLAGGKLGEAGAHPECPYRNQHSAAEHIEQILCAYLGMRWDEHEENVDSVYNK